MSFKKFGYARVSSVDQKTDRQIAQLKEYNLKKIFEEHASGKDLNRPQLQNMLGTLKSGDHIYVCSMDRLARNLADLLSLTKNILEKKCTIHFLKENLIFSSDKENNPMGKLLLSIMGAVSEFERALIRERQAEGIALAKLRGAFKGSKPALTDEKRKKFYQLKRKGFPITYIAKELKVSRATIYRHLIHSHKC